jgi:hypothetical protein
MNRATLFACCILAFLAAPEGRAQSGAGGDAQVLEHANNIVAGAKDQRRASIAWLVERGNKDAIPALIQALRFNHPDGPMIRAGLAKLAGEQAGATWYAWMLWQQAHPEIVPFAGFAAFKAALYSQIDPDFRRFLHDGVAHEIRLEEIAWGGVPKDGIPALTDPALIEAGKADYLTEGEPVFGVAINGDARAYPLRIMDWHEMLNDVVGGVPVSLAYCTLCGSAILFETAVPGRARPFVFGSSGFLYRSNKLMYDQETHSLWNQFTGRPVVGPLTGSGIELATRPVVIATWRDWRRAHPDTKVLSLETGHQRDYQPGRPYGAYFASPDLIFPALVDETQLKAKDYVFALRGAALAKAWPLSLFDGGAVINDTAGVLSLTLIGDAASRTVRAYRTGGEAFAPSGEPGRITLDGRSWTVTEDALQGPEAQSLPRLPGHIAYWFAWSGYFGEGGEVAGPRD